jgi:hypothetical protein
MHQIITRNSKNDSSPICRYREEGAQVADMGSTENKRAKSFKEKKKSQCSGGGGCFWSVLERERLFLVEGTGLDTTLPHHSIPSPLSPPFSFAFLSISICVWSPTYTKFYQSIPGFRFPINYPPLSLLLFSSLSFHVFKEFSKKIKFFIFIFFQIIFFIFNILI